MYILLFPCAQLFTNQFPSNVDAITVPVSSSDVDSSTLYFSHSHLQVLESGSATGAYEFICRIKWEIAAMNNI